MSEQLRDDILKLERAVRMGYIDYDEYFERMNKIGGVLSLSRSEWEVITNQKHD